MSVILAGDAIAGDWNLFVEEILRPLEARSSVVDNEEYEKEEALDEKMQLQYAMMSLGLQGNQEKDEGEGELEVPRSYADNNDQFHFDEAHDLDDDDIDYADNAVSINTAALGMCLKQVVVALVTKPHSRPTLLILTGQRIRKRQ